MRQIRALEARFDLTVAGFGPAPVGNISFHDIGAARGSLPAKTARAVALLAGLYEYYYWRSPFVRKTLAAVHSISFDLIIANDVVSLPLALQIAQSAPVMLDAHEYSPKEFEDLWRWRFFFAGFYTYLCRKYLPRVASMTTVCRGIAEAYQQFGVSPKVVLNCPAQQHLPIQPVDPDRIRLIHHGGAVRSRRIELMIEMMHHLDHRHTLDLMLVDTDPRYMIRLRDLAAADSRIRFRSPAPMEDIAETINKYDIGVFLLPPVNFNYRMALPNKFFEFIQARLAVAIGPSPEMARLATKCGFGIVARSFKPQELAACISALSAEDIEHLKHQADQASHELHAGRSAEILLSEVQRLLV
jgi:hypothetical protein